MKTRKALIALALYSTALVAAPNNPMPVAEQNTLVQKRCAVCHTDAARNGGLSLQHFDASNVDPSLAAMLVSKLKGGAMGAAGKPFPDETTTQSLINALTSEAAGAHKWTVKQTQDVLTAGILRELPSARNAGRDPAVYRLVLACNTATRQGEMQLSWAPAPMKGTLSASLDGGSPATYQVEGDEKMGDGTPGTTGPAAIALHKLPMPQRTLSVGGLFPGETVTFPFDTLAPQTRTGLSPCFTEITK